MVVAIKGLGIGGAERLISEGARFWDRDAFDYHVVYALPWKDQLVQELEQLGVPTHLVGGPRGMTFKTIGSLRRVLRRLDAQLVHAHLPLMGVAARLSAQVPVVYTEHNLTSSYRYPSRTLNRLTYGRNATAVAVSHEVATSLAGYPGPTPRVIPNGVFCAVEEGDARTARSELGLRPEDPLVVHVGNIRPHKGHETLIGAAAALARVKPEVTVVSIGGEKRPGDLARVRTQAAESGIGNRLRFMGRRADALRFIAAANVFVNPSDVEGLPVTILEAMALGTPVVATAVGGVKSVVEDRSTGILIDAGDPVRLADGIMFLLDHPGEARDYAVRGQKVVEERYGLERMVREYEDLYRALLDAR